MIRLRSILPCLLLAVTCGCSTLKVRHDYDTRANFAELESYSWLEHAPGPIAIDDPRINVALFESRLKEAVNEALGEMGYRELDGGELDGGEIDGGEVGAGEVDAEEEKPDFFVGYFVTLDRKVDVNVVNNYHGYGWMRGPHVYVDEYDEGTLIIDIVDASSRAIIWRGIATDRVDFLATPGKREERIREAVDKMLEPFPPLGDE